MVSPRIDALVCDTLRYRNLFRGGVVSDAQIRRTISEMVEDAVVSDFGPGYGKGRAFGLSDLVVNEGICQSSQEPRLAGPASGDSELDWQIATLGGTAVYFCRLNITSAMSGRSVKMRTGCHDGQT